MPLIYKPLFEVKLTHEYYVSEYDGQSIFALNAQKERLDFLVKQFNDVRESVNRDIDFQFPEAEKLKYAEYNLKLLPAYSGFKVVIRVNQQTLPDNSLVYSPYTPLPGDMDININIVKRNGDFDSYTNNKLHINVPQLYFFCNDDLLNTKKAPFICNDVAGFNEEVSYEQGELSYDRDNDAVNENYKTVGGSGEAWDRVIGKYFANENDRLLLPLKFYYSFGETDDVTEATFRLQGFFGNMVTEFTKNATGPFKRILLDFSAFANVLTKENTLDGPGSIFRLTVTGSNGYSKTHNIIFNDSLYNVPGSWGVINIKTNPLNSAFRLIETDGFLKRRKNSLGDLIDAPVFEIPVKSKFTYWRFIIGNDKKPKTVSGNFSGCLVNENNVLLSLKPRRIAKYYYFLPKTGSDPVYAPNPVLYDLKRDEKDRLFFDIRVPASDMFPVV